MVLEQKQGEKSKDMSGNDNTEHSAASTKAAYSTITQECDPPGISREGEGIPLILEHCSKTLEKELYPLPSSTMVMDPCALPPVTGRARPRAADTLHHYELISKRDCSSLNQWMSPICRRAGLVPFCH
ncbi:hypothetical protein AV530_014810 [Patagioenas fasciata monilis]|uniref:Uncharacterized protein n=1 Tax=Patagioenas fasciata monilis TaxID=372326 RepID=A0A1V4L0R7_PATFA|nr:hypothetical protein AV530_014810 [Patagioenas fasciata monilis]